ncbi:putative cytochrome P450 [Aspergillus costaricaensis CBS 115574]|uniref:Cytochrome P450 n=1 Tax=Aspergillus costaricaensis CBS 115574 TaxID=1448317 RepID=A0ACD1IJN5_9EURO|nr:putative cytochrome P450 [Aspergillus costaricaensis CBS 115574]RAK90788.1 putative cytochrome P450 [Aspergillus costaricaensis CBS 115574]
METVIGDHQIVVLSGFDSQLIIALIFILLFVACLYEKSRRRDNIPTVNRWFTLEPTVFSRIRFALNSGRIMEIAYQKYKGQAYRLARGDADYIVLPAECVTELNRLPQHMLNSRQCHSYSMTGHLNGINIVLKSNLHVRLLLNTITPALPRFLQPTSVRIEEEMKRSFPQDKDSWKSIDMTDRIAVCVGRAFALAVVGAPMCDNAEFIRLMNEYTKDVFYVMFIMRLVPSILQPLAVWLLPSKWRLRAGRKRLEAFIRPNAKKQREEDSRSTVISELPSLFKCIINEARNESEQDPEVVTGLLMALAVGGTYSAANFIYAAILDLTAHPHYLAEIREELHLKNAEISGRWDFEAFNSLHKLDSACKETLRLTPGSLTTYSRVMQDDYTLSNGITLRKGQFICVHSNGRARDSSVYPDANKYDALRAYKQDFRAHTTCPFKGVYGQDFRWGSGRWACAGRYLASMVCKIMLVKLLDEYDFQFEGSEGRPANTIFHEYVFIRPGVKLMMRRREGSLGIRCV